jgi:hypothetical protein
MSQDTRMSRDGGSVLVAALALVFLIFAITTLCLGRVISSSSRVAVRHGQSSALFLAEAGIQKAARQATADPTYTGERETKLPTGHFDVRVERGGSSYVVTSTGYAASPLREKTKVTVRARVSKVGGGFRVTDWEENP